MRSSLAILSLWICFKIDATQSACPNPPQIENAYVSEASRKPSYSPGSQIHYTCEHGYVSMRKITYICSENKWTRTRFAECTLRRCELPADIPNGRYTILNGDSFVMGVTIKYTCKDGYQMMSRSDTRTCHQGGWDNQLPVCEEIVCAVDMPTDKHIKIEGLSDNEDSIRRGHSLQFSCEQGLILKGNKEITCQANGEWSSPFPKCEGTACVANLTNMIVEGHPNHDNIQATFMPYQTLKVSCVQGQGLLQEQVVITCQADGNWNGTFPSCVGFSSETICPPPPNLLRQNADTVDMLIKTQYIQGEEVKYICFKTYVLEGTPHMTCDQGSWRGNFTCVEPCLASVEEMDKRNIELLVGGRERLYCPHLDHVTFVCKHGKKWAKNLNVVRGKVRLQCLYGKMTLPECE